MWLTLVLFTLVTYVDTTSSITKCPAGCNCQVSSSSLTIDCRHRPPIVNLNHLSNELDIILSASNIGENLTFLSVTNTSLTYVPQSVCNFVKLTSLNLNDNKLTKLPDDCFIKLTKLVTLTVRGNAIVSLQDGLFDSLQSLVSLDLSQNQIAFVGLRVFSNSSDLTSLHLLDLSWNRLTSLEPWWYYRCILGNETAGVKISLHHNLISNFTNKLQFRFRCDMKRPYGQLDLQFNRISHIMDILNGWNIEAGYISGTFWCLRNPMFGFPLMKIYVGAGTYACDCTDFDIYKNVKYFQTDTILSGVRCTNKVTQTGIPTPVTSIPLTKFICELTDHCPSNCQCVYRPANATLHVYCSAAKLSSLPLDLPPLPKSNVKYKLELSNNKLLRRLEHRPYFVNTSILDVSNCSLTDIVLGLLEVISPLSVVNVRGNMLQSFPRHSDTVNISARLLIGGNPWRCSCDNSWMIGWLQSLSGQISDPGDIICRSPLRMYGRNMLKSTKEDFCVDPVKPHVTVIASLAVAVATVVLVVIAVLLFHIFRLKFYKRWKFHPFDRDECVGEDMDYDVFLCFSSEDENPHGIRILELMESKGYRVCYHVRDFRPGLILDNIIQSIQRSKRTVCLLSTNFLTR